MPRHFRAAVIGSTGRGDYGHGLDRVWLDVDNVQLVAVADENPDGLAAAATRLKVDRTYADHRQMLDEVRPDVVSVCPRWVDQHRDMVLAAVERGIHVYCEKPLARSPREADEMLDAAARTHALIAVAQQTRYSPVLPVVQRLIADGAVGTLREIRARGKEDQRGGGEDLWVLGTHVLDLMRLFGGQPTRCQAEILVTGKPARPEHVAAGNEGLGPLVGDEVHARFSLPEGVEGRFDSVRGAAQKPSRFGVRMVGDKGVIALTTGYLPTATLTRTNAASQPITSAGLDQPEPLTDGGLDAGNRLAARDLLAAIEEQRHPKCSAYESRAVIEMITAVFAAHVAGGPVPFPLSNRDNPLAAWR